MNTRLWFYSAGKQRGLWRQTLRWLKLAWQQGLETELITSKSQPVNSAVARVEQALTELGYRKVGEDTESTRWEKWP